MKKIKMFIFTGKFFTVLLAVVQLYFFIKISFRFSTAGVAVYTAVLFFSLRTVWYISGRDDINTSYKISWFIIMMIMPLSGVVFCISRLERKMAGKSSKNTAGQPEGSSAQQKNNIPECLYGARYTRQMLWLYNTAGARAYENTQVKYYPDGNSYFADLLRDIRKAEKSIFLQYFIIDHGTVWESVFRRLKEKAEQGLDVRVIYDGVGCMLNFPQDFAESLRCRGIKTGVFNEIRFSLNVGSYLQVNHRDHRKIAVIDSSLAYSGGINIADEYVNRIQPFGQWKDSGFRLKGRRVYSFTSSFLQSWHRITGREDNGALCLPADTAETDGMVQPFFSAPSDKYSICANAYINMINRARQYVYISTPYLITDSRFLSALKVAASSGVDVRIVIPGIPDKWYVYYVTQSYYRVLLAAGVKIYEYTPGFVHAKMYISDDRHAIVGGANTDYRSMYLNYESCCSFYDCSIVKDVKKDFLSMFLHCHAVTLQDLENTSLLKRRCQTTLRILAPFM